MVYHAQILLLHIFKKSRQLICTPVGSNSLVSLGAELISNGEVVGGMTAKSSKNYGRQSKLVVYIWSH